MTRILIAVAGTRVLIAAVAMGTLVACSDSRSSTPADAAGSDGNPPASDAAPGDGPALDASRADTAPPDAAPPDTAPPDTAPPDAMRPDGKITADRAVGGAFSQRSVRFSGTSPAEAKGSTSCAHAMFLATTPGGTEH